MFLFIDHVTLFSVSALFSFSRLVSASIGLPHSTLVVTSFSSGSSELPVHCHLLFPWKIYDPRRLLPTCRLHENEPSD